MAADVFAQAEQFAGAGEEGGGMQAARGAERVLSCLQMPGQLVDQRARHLEPVGWRLPVRSVASASSDDLPHTPQLDVV